MILPRVPVDSAAVADHYDDLDRLYREVWGEHVHHGLWISGDESPAEAVRRLVERVADAAGIGPGSRVCDIGCGYGATARLLALERGADVTGITLSRAQRDHALERDAPATRVRIVLGDWLDNGLAESVFDAAIAIESTEHMEDKARCFAEARRVLRPGGRLVVCAWLAAERPRAWQVRRLLEPICREGRLPGMGTAAEYRALVATAGLDVVSFDDLTARVARTWSICLRRSVARLLTDRQARGYFLGRRAAGRHRDFLPALLRIRLAYATGAMRYGLLVAQRPSSRSGSSVSAGT